MSGLRHREQEGKENLFQLTTNEPQRWGTRVFGLGACLENHWGDPAVLKILRLEIKAANISLSLSLSQLVKLIPWTSGYRGKSSLPPWMGLISPCYTLTPPLIKMIALANSSHQLVQ
jgi:hypothetical protein